MDELIQEFLVESNENLDRFDGDLVKLESAPGHKELLSSIFRSIHSIKGACGFLGFQKLEKLAHAGENLLSKLRDGELPLTPEIGSALLESGDRIRQMLGSIGETGTDGEEQFPELIERLIRLQDAPAAQPSPAKAELAASNQPESKPKPKSEPEPELKSNPEPKPEPKIELPVETAAAAGAALQASAEEPRVEGGMAIEKAEDRMVSGGGGIARPVPTGEPAASTDEAGRSPEEGRGKAGAADSTIRVNVTVLDRLMTLVGELVLARNQLLQFANTLTDAGFHGISQHMNLIATELQEEVMKTRMQPIGNIWSKFPRTVRDLVVSCGKEVRVEMEGKETELDKTIIEAIKDPMTHLVRNSVDHGIEFPAARVKAGKDPVGLLRLRAFHEGGQVNIEISDDGAGLNSERIRAKAVERGVVTAERATRMTEGEVFNLIFLPGFSTAEKVTNVSGRGVGMDVVRTNIERIGGTVDVQSAAGKGTTIRVKIPLTLAIIPALVVRSAGDRFAIPQVALTELVSLEAGDTKGGIEMVHGAPVYRLRGQLLPLIYLNRELRIETAETQKAKQGPVNIVVLRVDNRQFGLVVDEINDTEEIVVKPLQKQLKNVKTFAGASIMGDGRVALILDVPGLAQRANLGVPGRDDAARDAAKSSANPGEQRQTLLLFEGQGRSRMAIPLSSVARLEEFGPDRIEHCGGQEVVQYRGQILPLIRISELVGGRGLIEEMTDGVQKPLEVVVYTEGERSVGLVVDHILDIVEETLVVRHNTGGASILGAAVVQQKVTELLDVAGLVRAAHPKFFEAGA